MDYKWYREQFEKALIYYNPQRAKALVEEFQKEDLGISFIDKVMVQALTSIGEKWERDELALSQVYMSSRLCEKMADELLPKASQWKNHSLKMGIGVLSDYHVLGKKIVKAVLQASGYEIIDLGFGLEVDDVIEKAKYHELEILIISVLMYPSALKVKDLSEKLKAIMPEVKLLVGGAPFVMDRDLWKEVGADAMGVTASDDLILIEHWLGKEVAHG